MGAGGLDSHLNGPAHMQEFYHCPNNSRCEKQFKSLAAMFNHLESESCGFIEFGGVQKNARSILSGSEELTEFA